MSKISIGKKTIATIGLMGAAALALLARTPRPSTHEAPAPAAEVAAQDGDGWAVGARYLYEVDLGVTIGLPEAGASDGERLRVAGMLQTTVIAAGPDDARELEYHLPDARVGEPDAPPSPEGRAFEVALRQPFYVRMDAAGHVRAVSFAPRLATTPQTLLRNLVATLQVPRATSRRDTFDQHEMDANGEAMVRHTCASEGCAKQKLSYLRLATRNGLRAPGAHRPRINHSRFAYVTDRHGRLVRMTGREVTVVDLLGAPLRAELTLVAALRATRREPPALTGIPAGLESLALAAVPSAATDEPQIPEDLRGVTTRALLTEHLAIPAESREARGRAMSRLASLLTHDPKAVEEARRLLREGAPGARELVEALGGVSSAQGQSVLAEAIGSDRLTLDVRAAAMRSALVLDQPTPTLVDALRTQMKGEDPELRNRARVAFGAGANHLREAAPNRARAMTDELLADLGKSSASDERTALLRAIGNTGHERAADAVVGAVADGDRVVREAAVRALRFVPAEDADRAIERALASDPAPEVRRAALFAAEFRTPATVAPAVAAAARQDADTAVRGEALRVLAKLAPGAPVARDALAELAARDPDPERRALAQSLLDRTLAQAAP